jgi:glycosyltransferase involved in cell wall biosynthesis
VYEGHTVGVVVPAYNEEGFIGDVIEALPGFVDRAYVVDDASTDGTWEEVRRHVPATNGSEPRAAIADGGSAYDRRIVPIRHETNSGRGAAVKTGYRRALDDGMDAIAVIDGDGQHDPAILDRFLDPIVEGRADYAKGNRLLSSAHRERMSRWRLFGNTVLTYLTKVASGYWRMMDPQNGYTVISARALQSIDVDGLYDDYGFLNDVLVKLNVADVRIVDVAMRARYGEEDSGIRYSTFVPKLSRLLLSNFLWRLGTKYLLFDFHPLVGLYALGGLGATGGLVYLGWALGTTLTPLRAALGFTLLLLSGLFVTLAMIFDRAHNVSLEDRIEEGIP